MANNFDLAPPSKTVDGMTAVPIDIQRITATLSFDGSTSLGTGDATLEFTTGPKNGNPIFDLRQTITSAWLDGVSIPVGKLAHHDFGGGADAQLRIVASELIANTAHTLRVKYSLGPPQASQYGAYLPEMTWSPGPRLAFNFGFTDLGAGRYLEAWIPANLIFDQFELVLTLKVINTTITHTVITNGTVTPSGTNQWSVTFPKRFTALSPLVEVRAADRVVSETGTTVLPVSGTSVTIEAWKRTGTPIDLTAEINNLKTHLANNETAVGAYVHGSRFVAILGNGAMEYEGATTTVPGSLRHETFHSWWARGVKPASQSDGWWDEAWTVYNDGGASGSLPFDFTEDPVELCPRNPWVRITAGGSYGKGARFFKGVAAMIGVAKLNALMSEFYKQHTNRPVTTEDIEKFLLIETGNAQLVDGFHRFVYGFADPSPAPNLWLRDAPAHAGVDEWQGAFWNSPDLWIRNVDDNGVTHQNPEQGQDNWFYARVRNRSATATARHFVVTFNVKQFAGTQFQYPADFLPCVAVATGFNLAPNSSRVVKARWPRKFVPPAGTHACWLASVLTRFDQPVASSHVWEHNNLAQKNLTIVNLKPDNWLLLPFVVQNLKSSSTLISLELVRRENQPQIGATLIQKPATLNQSAGSREVQPGSITTDYLSPGGGQLLDCGGQVGSMVESVNDILTSSTNEGSVAEHFLGGVELPFPSGRSALTSVPMLPGQQVLMGLRVRTPKSAKPGEVIQIDLVRRDDDNKSIIGGFAIEIHVT